MFENYRIINIIINHNIKRNTILIEYSILKLYNPVD